MSSKPSCSQIKERSFDSLRSRDGLLGVMIERSDKALSEKKGDNPAHRKFMADVQKAMNERLEKASQWATIYTAFCK